MPTTVRVPETHEFDVLYFARREGEDFVLYVDEVDSDGGEWHTPNDPDTDEAVGSALAEEVDREVGLLNEEDWDDMTPVQRFAVVRYLRSVI